MPYDRRDFLKSSAAATALVIAAPNSAIAAGRLPKRWIETESDELLAAALGAAKAAGATYADVRIGRYRSQNIGTRERRRFSSQGRTPRPLVRLDGVLRWPALVPDAFGLMLNDLGILPSDDRSETHRDDAVRVSGEQPVHRD